MSKKIKGEVLEIKGQEIYPVCEDCRHLCIDVKGMLRKKYTFDCGAQGFQSTSKVYNTENCKNIFRQQFEMPLVEVKFNEQGEIEA